MEKCAPAISYLDNVHLPAIFDCGSLRRMALIAEAGLVKGEPSGVDASTMEANAALRNIVRRDTGEGYRGGCWRAWPRRAASRHPRPLARLDRKRKGKKLSNQDWVRLEERPAEEPRSVQDEGRLDVTHLAAPVARGGSGHRRGGGRRATAGRRGRHVDAGEDAGGGQGESRGGGRGTDGRRPAECVTDPRRYHSHGGRCKGARFQDQRCEAKTRISEPRLLRRERLLPPLARRSGRPAPGSHQQPDPAVIGRGQA